ncbi:MAG TPA: hypothetical protein PKK01_08275 [Mycobacterium sp.]|nr:hypothetical protein [Mycobacterium sp.]
MADAADLDALFAAAPAEFTALCKQLADRAKKAGDRAGAADIARLRKPTTAARVVNLIALRTPKARQRLGELGEELRGAHRARDGERIRELSARQRRLVEELAELGFALAGPDSPPPRCGRT